MCALQAYLQQLTNSLRGERVAPERDRESLWSGEINFMEMVDQQRTPYYKLHNATKEGDDVCVRVLSNIHMLHFPT